MPQGLRPAPCEEFLPIRILENCSPNSARDNAIIAIALLPFITRFGTRGQLRLWKKYFQAMYKTLLLFRVEKKLYFTKYPCFFLNLKEILLL